jgi:hypothetical protein
MAIFRAVKRIGSSVLLVNHGVRKPSLVGAQVIAFCANVANKMNRFNEL